MTNDRLCELAQAREAMYQLDMNSFYEKGEEAGIKKGLKEGEAKGLKKGKAEGLKEGEAKGEVKKAIEVTKKLVLEAGMTLEQAMTFSGLDGSYKAEVEKLLGK